MARPDKLTPELQRAICTLVVAGLVPHRAAGSLGVSRNRFWGWMRDGALPEGKLKNRQLRLAIEKAKDQAIHRLVVGIAKAAQKKLEKMDTEDSKWLLTRLDRKNYGNLAGDTIKATVGKSVAATTVVIQYHKDAGDE